MRTPLIAVVLLTISGNAFGGDQGIYVGGALSQSTIDANIDFFGFGFEDEDTAYKLIVGIRPSESLAIEISYVNFGSIVFDNRAIVADGILSEYEAQAFDAFAVGFVGGPFIELFGKVGLVYSDTDILLQGGISGVNLRDSDSGADLAYGGGVQAQFASFAARLEYESFDVSGTDNLELWSLGVTWTFL